MRFWLCNYSETTQVQLVKMQVCKLWKNLSRKKSNQNILSSRNTILEFCTILESLSGPLAILFFGSWSKNDSFRSFDRRKEINFDRKAFFGALFVHFKDYIHLRTFFYTFFGVFKSICCRERHFERYKLTGKRLLDRGIPEWLWF